MCVCVCVCVCVSVSVVISNNLCPYKAKIRSGCGFLPWPVW